MDGQYRRAFAGAPLANTRQLWMTGWAVRKASNDAGFGAASSLPADTRPGVEMAFVAERRPENHHPLDARICRST